MRDLPFQYPHRWADLGPLLKRAATEGDDGLWDQVSGLLENRDRDLEDALSTGLDGVALWSTTIFTVDHTSGATSPTWDHRSDFGAGVDWGFDGSDLLVPAGVYLLNATAYVAADGPSTDPERIVMKVSLQGDVADSQWNLVGEGGDLYLNAAGPAAVIEEFSAPLTFSVIGSDAAVPEYAIQTCRLTVVRLSTNGERTVL